MMALIGAKSKKQDSQAATIIKTAVQALNVLRGMSMKAPDPGRLDECLTCLAFSSWQETPKQEILATLLRLGVTHDYLSSKHSVLLRRLTDTPVEKPLPPLAVDDPKGNECFRATSLKQVEREKQLLQGFNKLLDAWNPRRCRSHCLKKLLDAWSCRSHRLREAYSRLSDEDAKLQAEAAMRKKCRELLGSGNDDFFSLSSLLMSCSMRGFQMLAIQITMNSRYLKALKSRASNSSSLPLLLDFLSHFVELMLGGVVLQERGLRLVFVHWYALLLEELEVAESNVCWVKLIELSTTTLVSEDEDQLLQLLCKTCRPSNPLLQGMRLARKNTNADIRSHG